MWQQVDIEAIKSSEKGSLVSGPFGSNIGSRFFVSEGVPIIRGSNLTLGQEKFVDSGFVFVTESKANELRNCAALSEDLIFTVAGTLGQVGIIPKDSRFGRYIISNKQVRLRLNVEKCSPQFAYYYLSSPAMRSFIAAQNKGSSVPLLTLGILKRIPIHLPPLHVQHRIAALLSAYDDLIENTLRRIALLEQMAEQLYREWFVRFRFPGYQQAKFEKGMPSDWKSGRFSDLCTLQRGFDLPDSQITPGTYPVVASTSIKAYHNAFKIEPPVITTGRSGSLGEVLWINERAWPLNTALFVKNFHGNSPFFVFHTLRSMHLENFNAGAGVPSLNRNHLKNLPVSIPPPTLQEAFAAQVAPMQTLRENLEKSCAELIKTRDLLLPRLISGKLRVDDLDIQFSPSMQTERA